MAAFWDAVMPYVQVLLPTIVLALLTLGAGCFGAWLLWSLAPLDSAMIIVLVALGAVQALGAFALSPALTALLSMTAGDGADAAIALNTSGTYLGVTAAGALGGVVLATQDAGAVVAVSGVIVCVAAGLFALTVRARRQFPSRETS